MNENAIEKINDIRDGIIKEYDLNRKKITRNNIIYLNDELVLIQNITTGDLKVKRNLR